MSTKIDFEDVIYNRTKYLADGREIRRVRLEIVTADGKTFWVHAHDHHCQKLRIEKKNEKKNLD